MADYVFRLPDVGEGIAQAEIVAWHVNIGDTVKLDAPLVDVMTDKATVEIGAPVAGRIANRKGTPGEMARVGDELVTIETEAAGQSGTPNKPQVAPAPAKGNGASNDAAAAADGARPTAAAPPLPRPSGKVLASPAVRARATALGVDLATVAGTGEGGRVEHADLDGLLTRRAPSGHVNAPPASTADEDVPVIGLRRQIANAMQDSKRRIPHFAYVEEVDVTNLEALRAKLNERYGETRPKLTLLPFLIRAMVRAAAVHRGVNAHYDDQAAVIHRYAAVHMGVATETPRGLVVPVVRDAGTLGLWEVAAEVARLGEAARNGKATRDELTGSTITVSSLGRLGGIMATPIIKPPEVAIVGVNKIAERPVVEEGRVVVRKMMNLSSSFDHRVVDGFDAAAFIQSVRASLEAPAELFID